MLLSVGLMFGISSSALALSIPVTEGMVNDRVGQSFPKTVQRVELSKPEIILLEGKSLLCMQGVPKIPFFNKPFKVCASFKPTWNSKEAQLEATKMELTELNMEGVGSVPASFKGLLSEVLVAVEPLVLYKSDSWFLKQIDSVEVNKGMMYLKF